MGSKGATTASLSTPVVCCMCGDHGLLQELFQCKVCLLRSQHKYCSDLYPKTESYIACNWCLREVGSKSLPKDIVKDMNTSPKNADVCKVSTGSIVKLSRSTFSSQLNKPVKKLRLLNRSVSDVTDRVRSGDLSPKLGRGKQAFRGKARRYKLLEEVSS